MAGHLVEGAHRVARGDRLVDRGVVADREAVGVGHVDRRRALVDQPVDQDLVDADEDRVAGDRRQLVVEGDVGADELGRVADRRDVGVERGLQARDVLVGGDARRLPGDARLEQEARLLHVRLALAGRATARRMRLASWPVRNLPEGVVTRARVPLRDLDEALLLQDEQGLRGRKGGRRRSAPTAPSRRASGAPSLNSPVEMARSICSAISSARLRRPRGMVGIGISIAVTQLA